MIAIEKCKIGAKVAPKWGFRSRFLSIFLWYRHHVWSMIVGAFSSRVYPISPQSVSFDQLCIVRVQTISQPVMELSFQNALTPLTWLIQTSFLPSNWNLDKIFALTGELGQVHMAKKIFPIFLHEGRWLFLLGSIHIWRQIFG